MTDVTSSPAGRRHRLNHAFTLYVVDERPLQDVVRAVEPVFNVRLNLTELRFHDDPPVYQGRALGMELRALHFSPVEEGPTIRLVGGSIAESLWIHAPMASLDEVFRPQLHAAGWTTVLNHAEVFARSLYHREIRLNTAKLQKFDYRPKAVDLQVDIRDPRPLADVVALVSEALQVALTPQGVDAWVGRAFGMSLTLFVDEDRVTLRGTTPGANDADVETVALDALVAHQLHLAGLGVTDPPADP